MSNVRFAVSHSERTDLSEPAYLLPKEHQLDNVVVTGSLSENELAALFIKQKEAMTGQAKARGSSPFWEGVVVLGNTDAQEQSTNLLAWKKAYEQTTGHKVLHMSVHLDEGYMDTQGKPVYNPHAHVIVSRMDEKNRVIKLERKELAAVQDLTAETLKMQRGSTLAERGGKRGRAHIGHKEFRLMADESRLDLEKPKADLARLQKKSKEWSDADLSKINQLQANLNTAIFARTVIDDGLPFPRVFVEAYPVDRFADTRQHLALRFENLMGRRRLNGLERGQIDDGRADVLRRAGTLDRSGFAGDLLRAFPVVHGAQRQRVGRDAVAADFARQVADEANRRRFGRAISAQTHAGCRARRVGVDGNDATPAALNHRGQDGLAGVHQAVQIELQPRIPLGRRRLQKRRVAPALCGDASVVHKNIDKAHFGLDTIDHGEDRCAVRQVGSLSRCLEARFLQLARCAFICGAAPARRHGSSNTNRPQRCRQALTRIERAIERRERGLS